VIGLAVAQKVVVLTIEYALNNNIVYECPRYTKNKMNVWRRTQSNDEKYKPRRIRKIMKLFH